MASASVVPAQSVQWYPSVLRASGLEVIRLGHFPACNSSCMQLVWRGFFEVSWFHVSCNPKYTKTIMVLISMACTEWCWSTHTCEQPNWNALGSSKRQVKTEFTETCPLDDWCPVILSFQTGMDVTLLNYICLGVYGLLTYLQWCSRVVYVAIVRASPVEFQCGTVSTNFFQLCPNVPCNIRLVAQWHHRNCNVLVTLDQPVAFQCTLGHPVYTGPG